MHAFKRRSTFGLLSLALVGTAFLGACDAAPGSKAWCEKMAKMDKTTWSVEDAKLFAEKCVAEPVKKEMEDMKDDLPQ